MEHGKSTKKWPAVGPGLIVAATGVGAGDLVAALVAGTNFGLVFLWAIIIGAILTDFRKKSPILKECAGRSPMSRWEMNFGWL
ncbi:hypothetical protein P4U23_01530 [Aeribacillus composti]|nr:hypothetical protein [Aeribacillus composti]